MHLARRLRSPRTRGGSAASANRRYTNSLLGAGRRLAVPGFYQELSTSLSYRALRLERLNSIARQNSVVAGCSLLTGTVVVVLTCGTRVTVGIWRMTSKQAPHHAAHHAAT